MMLQAAIDREAVLVSQKQKSTMYKIAVILIVIILLMMGLSSAGGIYGILGIKQTYVPLPPEQAIEPIEVPTDAELRTRIDAQRERIEAQNRRLFESVGKEAPTINWKTAESFNLAEEAAPVDLDKDGVITEVERAVWLYVLFIHSSDYYDVYKAKVMYNTALQRSFLYMWWDAHNKYMAIDVPSVEEMDYMTTTYGTWYDSRYDVDITASLKEPL
jgi:hypothetical protein